MLTEQQKECIELLCIGTQRIEDIAKQINCTSRAIYKWKKENEEFKAELQKRSHDFKNGILEEANTLLINKLGMAINNIIDIANNKSNSDKVRLDANEYIINRILGNTTTKIEQSTDNKDSNADSVDIDSMLNALNENEKVIKLPDKAANK